MRLQVEACLSQLVLGGGVLRRVSAVFARELARGLRQQPSSLQMENTYVPELPDGTGTAARATPATTFREFSADFSLAYHLARVPARCAPQRFRLTGQPFQWKNYTTY